MSPARKRDSSSVSVWGGGLFSWLLGPGRPALILVLLVGLFGVGAWRLWLKFKPWILSSPEYRVGPEQVEITPPLPPWIHCRLEEFRGQVFHNSALERPLNSTDEDLTERIAKAFTQHPWVAKVVGVSKHPQALVQVELVYRQPVCMVEVPGGLLPVDADGVLLPSDGFSPIEAHRYPRLVGVGRKPLAQPGSRWTDAAVIGGAEIAAAMRPIWETMNFQEIVASAPQGNANSSSREPTFTLVTQRHTQIFWGYAPVANVLGEAPAAEKVERLKQFWAKTRHVRRRARQTATAFYQRDAGDAAVRGIPAPGQDSPVAALAPRRWPPYTDAMSIDPTEIQGGPERRRARDMSLQRGHPPTQVPGYEPEQFLGVGAMAKCGWPWSRIPGRRVAIKFYAHRGGLDWSLLSREVEKLAFLFADRYVVQLVGVGWNADPPYYIMEYLDKGSLADRIARGPGTGRRGGVVVPRRGHRPGPRPRQGRVALRSEAGQHPFGPGRQAAVG